MLRKAHPTRGTIGLIALGFVLSACDEPQRPVSPGSQTRSLGPRSTAASAQTSSLLARALIAERFNVKRKTGTWQMDVAAKEPTEMTVATLTWAPGGHSGWHSHPGPVFILITSGSLTFYDSDDPSCMPVVRTAGQVFVDAGTHSHISRNETGATATALTVVFAPSGSNPRIDEPDPGNCSS